MLKLQVENLIPFTKDFYRDFLLNKFYVIYLVQTKEMAQKGYLWPGVTKTNLKNMKTEL